MNDAAVPLHSPFGALNGTSRGKEDSGKDSEDEFQAQINRDVTKYRLKYLCNCSAFCRYSRMRIPSGKAVNLVFAIIFLERFAYFAALGIIVPAFMELYPKISDAVKTLVQSVSLNILIHLMFPLVGWLADAWIGRYRMIHLSLWVLFFGYASVVFSFSIEASLDNPSLKWRNILPVIFVIINVGSAAFLATTIPFGADQIVYRSSDELSSYFYTYYWVYNLSAVSIIFTFSCKSSGTHWHAIIYGLFSTLCITVALSLNAILRNWLFINPEKRNPIKMIGKVYYSAMFTKRPRHRSAFSYSGTTPPSRIDLVKKTHGGQFSSEEVEDAKTFGRLLIVLLAIVGVNISYSGIIDVIPMQMLRMKHIKTFSFTVDILNHCTVSDSFVWIVNIAVVLITIPVLNQCIFPFLRNYTPNMLKRIGIGYILTILSIIALLLITLVGQAIVPRHEWLTNVMYNSTQGCMFTEKDMVHPTPGFVYLPINSFLTVIPHVIVSLAEVFFSVSSLEFFYAQSPHTIRGLMIGLVFFTWGLGGTIANVFVGAFSLKKANPPLTCEFWYYLLLLLIATLSFVIYVIVARWYKNRRRPEDSEDELFYNNLSPS